MYTWELNTKKYLNSVRRKNQIIEQLKEEKEGIAQLIYSIGSLGADEKVQKSPSANQLTNQLIRLEEKKAELAAGCNVYAEFRLKVIEEIHKIPNENQREVLYRHYLQFESFHTIAEKMYLNYAYVTRLHRYGIQAFYRTNKEVVEKSLFM